MKVQCSRAELVALGFVTCATLALSYTQLTDGDLGFHLATGREVLAQGRIPETNVLSYTNPSYPWHLHQWLPGVLFEWVSRAFGVGGLQALKMSLVSATWLVVYAGARALQASPSAAALATLLGASAAAFRFELRPYLFTHLALAGTAAGCAHFMRAVSEGRDKSARRGLAIATAVPVLACHFHAGVIDSWLVLFALTFAVLAEALRARLTRSSALAPCSGRHAVRVAGALLASVSLSALTLSLYHPIGARILLFPFDMGSDAYLAEHLVEFRTPFSFGFLALVPYWFSLALVLATLGFGVRRLHLFWLLLVSGFLLLSLRHARLAFGFAVVASPVLAVGIDRVFRSVRKALRSAILAVTCVAALVYRFDQVAPGSGLASQTFPPYLFQYLEQHALEGPDYVSDAWAAPLLGRTYPRRKAFFDNRFEAYPRRFFVEVYQHIRYGKEGWDRLLDRYGVQLVLMRYTSAGEARLQQGKPNLRQLLARDPRWSLVTFDDLGMLFVRREGVNSDQARRFALPGIEPDGMTFLSAPRSTREALRRELARGNTATRVLLFAAHAELASGNRAEAQALLARASRDPSASGLLAALNRSVSSRPPPTGSH